MIAFSPVPFCRKMKAAPVWLSPSTVTADFTPASAQVARPRSAKASAPRRVTMVTSPPALAAATA